MRAQLESQVGLATEKAASRPASNRFEHRPRHASASSRQGVRSDIQVLRGVAILAVVLYHAKLGLFASGFLGVDIFFVISGFLITGLIARNIDEGTFRLPAFYFRRAKRLLPAAYVTFLVTALASFVFLTTPELKDFIAQMFGALTFTANFVLWHQSGYFDGPAELKPLLHIWSLSIEEQYYFIVPVTMLLLPRRFWLSGVISTLLASLALRIVFADHPSAVFYLLPTRAWELMIGSVGALVAVNRRGEAFLRLLFWPALLAVVLVPTLGVGRDYLLLRVLIVCLATLIVILRRHRVVFERAPAVYLRRIGDMSYSLYLVHWPLFAFFSNAWAGGVEREPSIARVSLVGLSLFLGYLLYCYVERPTHRSVLARPRRFTAGLVTASLVVAALTSSLWAARTLLEERDFAEVRQSNYGFGPECEFNVDFEPVSACRNSDRPKYLVWGDSYAMHLVPGLLASRSPAPEIVQATRSACGPMLGIAENDRDYFGPDWAKRCIAFNDSVVRYLKRVDSITTVVLSSPFEQLFAKPLLERKSDGSFHIVAGDIAIAVAALKRTIDSIRAAGKKTVVVAPPPQADFDVSRCLERENSHLLTLGDPAGCVISGNADQKERSAVLQFLNEVPSRAAVDVIDFNSFLCAAGVCRTKIDGVYIYRDKGHFSVEGSRYFIPRMSLLERIDRQAR